MIEGIQALGSTLIRRGMVQPSLPVAGLILVLVGTACHSDPETRSPNRPSSGVPAPLNPAGNRLEERMKMIEEQLKAPGRDITHPGVLQAMERVPRHEFVPEAYQEEAYEDRPLPIGHRQTISQPFIVAYMTEKLAPEAGDRVLEIGTGSGYQAAILSRLVKEVYSIEIVEPLARSATNTLERLGYLNVHVRWGDGFQGWPEEAPFDAIIVTCAPEAVPEPLTEQLKEGGRMVIPVGDNTSQHLVFLQKKEGALVRQAILPVRFVPMTGEATR